TCRSHRSLWFGSPAPRRAQHAADKRRLLGLAHAAEHGYRALLSRSRLLSLFPLGRGLQHKTGDHRDEPDREGHWSVERPPAHRRSDRGRFALANLNHHRLKEVRREESRARL